MGSTLGIQPRHLAVIVSGVVAIACALTLFATPGSASVVRTSGQGVSYAGAVRSWPMFGNGAWSDCTLAAVGDLMQAWRGEAGLSGPTLSDAQAVNLFKAMGGPAHQGVSFDTILARWQSRGLDGNEIAGSAPLDPTDVDTTEQAIYLLGGVMAEVYLTPHTLRELANGHTVTSTEPGSPTLAHALTFIGYNSTYLTAVTFGHVVHVSWAWWLRNGVQEYGVVPQSFVAAGHGPVATLPTAYLLGWLSQHSS